MENKKNELIKLITISELTNKIEKIKNPFGLNINNEKQNRFKKRSFGIYKKNPSSKFFKSYTTLNLKEDSQKAINNQIKSLDKYKLINHYEEEGDENNLIDENKNNNNILNINDLENGKISNIYQLIQLLLEKNNSKDNNSICKDNILILIDYIKKDSYLLPFIPGIFTENIYLDIFKLYIKSDDEIISEKYYLFINEFMNKTFISKEFPLLLFNKFSSFLEFLQNNKEINDNENENENNNLILKKHLKRFPKLFRLFQCLYNIKDDSIINNNDNKSSICLLSGCISLSLNERKKEDDIYVVFHFLDSKFDINLINKNNQVISIGDKNTNYNLASFNINREFKFAIFRIIENKAFIFFAQNHSEHIYLGGIIDIEEDDKIFHFFLNFFCEIKSILFFRKQKKEKNKMKKEKTYTKIIPKKTTNYGTNTNILDIMKIDDNIENYINKNKIDDKIKNKCLLFLPKPLVKDVYLTPEYNLNFNKLKQNDYLHDIIFYVSQGYPTKIKYIFNNLNNICFYGGFQQFIPLFKLLYLINNNNKIKKLIPDPIEYDKKKDINKSDDNIIIKYLNIVIDVFYNLIFDKNKKIINDNLHSFNEVVTSFVVSLAEFDQKDLKLLNIEKIMILINISSINKTIAEEFYSYLDIKNDINSINNNINNNNGDKLPWQQYHNVIFELFIYNRMWSKKKLFIENNNTVKYKQLNYYTKSFQKPLLYPEIEYERNYPKFTTFNKKDSLYKDSKKEIINYDFSLSENNIFFKNITDDFNGDLCCLIKKTHHIKGKLEFIYEKTNSHIITELKFRSFINMSNRKCCNNKTKNLCYGSLFPSTKKDLGIVINIKIKDILFIIIRLYYYRLSAFEIFVRNNKSYYFNYHEDIDNINNTEENNKNIYINDKILKLFDNLNSYHNFKVINFNLGNHQKEFILGYYNNAEIYSNSLLSNLYYLIKQIPSNSKYINNYKEIPKSLSNYDLIILINLLSNRSFNDIYQYPIFPLIFIYQKKSKANEINNNNNTDNSKEYLKRDMNKQIGLQTKTNQSIKRKEEIEQAYKVSILEVEEVGLNIDDIFYFNTHYSNALYVVNYLLRIFPYSFCSIELLGNGFDDPNRLFSSIEDNFDNAFSQKGDIRELIPEYYYFPEMFINGNGLNFGKKRSGVLVDDVEMPEMKINISDSKNKKKTKKNDGAHNKIITLEGELKFYEFIDIMRNELEKNEHINDWLNIIFGQEQRLLKVGSKIKLFRKESEINFDFNKVDLNDEIIMKSVDFGLLPIQFFKNSSPKRCELNNYFSIDEDIIEKEQKHFYEDLYNIYLNYNSCAMYTYSILEEKRKSFLSKMFTQKKDNRKKKIFICRRLFWKYNNI